MENNKQEKQLTGILACKLNECPGFLKCKLAGIDFGLPTSFLWLFNLMLKAISVVPTYWTLHSKHSMKLMMNLLLQLLCLVT